MTSPPDVPAAAGSERVLGRVEGAVPGPLVVVIAGMHGNEPAGVEAARGVASALSRDPRGLRGTYAALAGNVAALRAGTRYVERDLGRLWTAEEVARARAAITPDSVERGELLELVRELDRLTATHTARETLLVELHSTSAPGVPFQAINDTLHDRALALANPLPLILGIEESVPGAMLDYMDSQGRSVIVVEGGQHEAPETAANLEAALWMILAAVGCVDPAGAPLAGHRQRLRDATRGAPAVVEVVHRHQVDPDDQYVTRPGLRHFQAIRRGAVVGDDREGPVTAPLDGLLLMPKYQDQGFDGFFIARPVRRGWLTVSTVLRALGADRLLGRLPGVRRDAKRPRRLLVDPHVARWLVVPIFHLCGYRRLPSREGRLVFARRIELPRGAPV